MSPLERDALPGAALDPAIARLRGAIHDNTDFPVVWIGKSTAESIVAIMERARDALLAEAPTAWQCFHCGESFTGKGAAQEHFGPSEHSQPACQIDATEYRAMEERMRRYNDEDSDMHRHIYRMKSEHQQALLREEEKGYARGLLVAAPSAQAPVSVLTEIRTIMNGTQHWPVGAGIVDAIRALAAAPPAPVVLRQFADGRVEHVNRGLCHDAVAGHESRDPDCAVCQALSAPVADDVRAALVELVACKDMPTDNPGNFVKREESVARVRAAWEAARRALSAQQDGK